MDPNIPVNIAALPYWVIAAVEAALYFCFKGNYQTTEAEPPKISGPNYVTVLTAALGISTGKIIFKWIPRVIVPKLSLNKEVIANLNNQNNSDAYKNVPGGGGVLGGSARIGICRTYSNFTCPPSKIQELCPTGFDFCANTFGGCDWLWIYPW